MLLTRLCAVKRCKKYIMICFNCNNIFVGKTCLDHHTQYCATGLPFIDPVDTPSTCHSSTCQWVQRFYCQWQSLLTRKIDRRLFLQHIIPWARVMARVTLRLRQRHAWLLSTTHPRHIEPFHEIVATVLR